MQHYVATRPMFIDVEVMNADTRSVLGDQGAQASPSNVARGLSSLYKEITGLKDCHSSLCEGLNFLKHLLCLCYSLADTVRKEAATILAVFPSPNEVMAILVQACMRGLFFFSRFHGLNFFAIKL